MRRLSASSSLWRMQSSGQISMMKKIEKGG